MGLGPLVVDQSTRQRISSRLINTGSSNSPGNPLWRQFCIVGNIDFFSNSSDLERCVWPQTRLKTTIFPSSIAVSGCKKWFFFAENRFLII